LQLLQLGEEVSSYDVTLQFLTEKRRRASGYNWIDATEAQDYNPDWPAGQGLWIDEDTSDLPEEPVMVPVGNAVQMDFSDFDEVPLKSAGQVSDADLSYTLHTGYNYVGNPFPTPLDIQNIQIDDSVASYDVTFQFLTSKRRRASGYNWIDATEARDYDSEWPEGLGLWLDEDTSGLPEEPVTIAPGGAVQFDMSGNDGVVVTVYSPFEL
jgi:azurin